MIKTIFKSIEKIMTTRFEKSGIREELVNHPNYAEKAKEIWDMIDKEFGIANTIENVLKLKIDKFDQMLIKKFPELTKDDIEEIKQSIIGGVNASKEIIVNQVNGLKQLQEENEKLKAQLKKIQSLLPSGIDTESQKNDK